MQKLPWFWKMIQASSSVVKMLVVFFDTGRWGVVQHCRHNWLHDDVTDKSWLAARITVPKVEWVVHGRQTEFQKSVVSWLIYGLYLCLNEKEPNPNPFINLITALPMSDAQDSERARQLPRALAAQVWPVMNAHGFTVDSLEEVCCDPTHLCRGLLTGKLSVWIQLCIFRPQLKQWWDD